jgi:hypothetical protein
MRSLAPFLGLTLAIAAFALSDVTGLGSPQQKKDEPSETPRARTDAAAKLLKTQLQAAKKAQLAAIDKMQVKEVGGVQVLVNSNHPNPEEAYNWSVRWLNAQRDLSETKDERTAAFADHAKRMKELKAIVTILVGDGKGGFMTPADAAIAEPAAEWYLAEAEVWLLKERGK